MKPLSNKKLKVGVIDLVHKGPTKNLYARVMHANLASIMPQVVATWCEQEGHDVQYICYTGFEDLSKELPKNTDIIFIGAFTQSALMAYALSSMFRAQGTVTVLGGPHARCYPDDAVKYFDFVTGFTDKDVIIDILNDAEQHRPIGLQISAEKQPTILPGVRERWKFIETTLKKAPYMKIVPMIASMGCPYTCSFCIDSVVPYQTMEYEQMKEDLRHIAALKKPPWVGWHDPNFGIRFNETLDAIESAVKPGSLTFVAESSLAVLTEKNLKRMQNNSFGGLLPGIESWYDMGNKSKASRIKGLERVKQVAEHSNMIMRYIPYLQVNFVFGLDSDFGSDPFELTKKFLDLSPGSFPAYSLLSAFGEAAPLNLQYQEEDRVLPFPFHFLNNHLAMNVKPKNYDWVTYYNHLIDITEYSFSWKAIFKRVMANSRGITKGLNFVRAISHEGSGRIKFFKTIRNNLKNDPSFRDYFEGKTTQLPQFYLDIIKEDLGHMWKWLPEGALYHDHKAYLKKHESSQKLRRVSS
ncbi:MAG: hypothetical protein KAQ79_08735 [Cyclobacteriaceae bacterium]|nr:hypothetical protein [Cyclobacteriaceae bacterium]